MTKFWTWCTRASDNNRNFSRKLGQKFVYLYKLCAEDRVIKLRCVTFCIYRRLYKYDTYEVIIKFILLFDSDPCI
jgi:hypothetical protein